jgi:hypothetical protein
MKTSKSIDVLGLFAATPRKSQSNSQQITFGTLNNVTDLPRRAAQLQA